MKEAMVVSLYTGEILHEFTPIEMFMGKQYWTAWCVGQFYTIEDIVEEANCTTYWVK